MKLLITSDTQADMSNLDLCQTSWEELLEAADKYKPDAILHLGDFKERYSPVDVPVVQWAIRAIKTVKKAGYRFIALAGNHDRISQTAESKNWLDILRTAGAETVSTPKIKTIGNGTAAFLPFTSNRKQEVKWAGELWEQAKMSAAPRILCLHTGVRGALMSAVGFKDTKASTIAELHIADYTAAFAGHFHMHQKICENAWYAGAPFCSSWSDANTVKGHVLVTIE